MNFVMEFSNFRIEYMVHYEYMIWYDADSHVFKWEMNCINLKPFSHPDHRPAQICILWYIFTHYLTGHPPIITKHEVHCGTGVHGDSDMHYSFSILSKWDIIWMDFIALSMSIVWHAFVAFQNI